VPPCANRKPETSSPVWEFQYQFPDAARARLLDGFGGEDRICTVIGQAGKVSQEIDGGGVAVLTMLQLIYRPRRASGLGGLDTDSVPQERCDAFHRISMLFDMP